LHLTVLERRFGGMEHFSGGLLRHAARSPSA
jgi:hypothetical protein